MQSSQRRHEPIVLCDIDGTLALRGDRDPYAHEQAMEDAVNEPIAWLCNHLDVPVMLMSGRKEKFRPETEYWLRTHRVLVNQMGLLMRDNKDNRPDEIVKQEWYERIIRPYYAVLFVLDDRNKVVKMWRDLGLTCLQVAEGDF
jgi:hypothetical protein